MRTPKKPNSQFFENNDNNSSEKKKYVRKKRYPYKLYIPENLDIDSILLNNPPEFKYYRDCFVYILHLINSIPMWIKDFDIERHKGFTPIDKVFLSSRIHKYKPYIEYLKRQKIVIEGTSHKPGHYARGLKFEEIYRTKVRAIYIDKNSLIKSITESNHNRDLQAENKLYYLKDWFNPKLTIDMEGVVEYLEQDLHDTYESILEKRKKMRIKRKGLIPAEDIVVMGYNMKYMVADKINDMKHLRLHIDSTSGRFHSPFTNLKKELRQFIRYDNEHLYSIDIVNSQPLLALVVLDYDLFIKNKVNEIIPQYNNIHRNLKSIDKLLYFSNPTSTMLVNLIKKSKKIKDVQLYKEAVLNGKFYELFANLLLEKGALPLEMQDNEKETRKFAKTAVFNAFFSPPQDVIWNVNIQAFRKCFPTVYRIFTLIKAGKNTEAEIKSGKKKHRALACTLQRFESNLMLHNASYEIHHEHPQMPLFTVHDSVVTTGDYVKTASEILSKHLKGALGNEPKIKIEKW